MIYSKSYTAQEQDILDLLAQNKKTLLVDTRKSPYSKRPGWNQADLEKRLKEQYFWRGDTLGNLNYLPKDRHKGIELIDEETGIERLCTALKKGYNLILLCGCPAAKTCHRTYIAKRLLRKWHEEYAKYFLTLIPDEELARLLLGMRYQEYENMLNQASDNGEDGDREAANELFHEAETFLVQHM